MNTLKNVQLGAKYLSELLPADFHPEILLVLGTGLGELAEDISKPVRVAYSNIPGYPVSTVASHGGRFSFGYFGGKAVAIQEGRCHLYEGYTAEEVVRGIRIMAELGVKNLLITNAAGSLNPLMPAGSIMAICDHINFTGQSPLTGLPDEPDRTRFPDMSKVYDEKLLDLAHEKALNMGLRLESGVYLGLTGPQLETRAETRMFRAWGADAVGMSTVMEVIAARHLGLKVLGFSVLSNHNLPDCMAPTNLEEIIATSAQTAKKLRLLLHKLIPEI